MDNIKKLTNFAEETQHPLYIEHNDFLNGGMTLVEEVDDLIAEGDITSLIGGRMKEQESIWSIRYYHVDGSCEIIYDATLDRAAHRMLEKLGIL